MDTYLKFIKISDSYSLRISYNIKLIGIDVLFRSSWESRPIGQEIKRLLKREKEEVPEDRSKDQKAAFP